MSEPPSFMGQSPVIPSNLVGLSDKTGLLNGVSSPNSDIPPLTESKSEGGEGKEEGEGEGGTEQGEEEDELPVPFETTL